ncbi:MAG TPA: AAA family ATPase [Syntrophorhabdaceae bacterium]|nr:AAA family ATPase [Syntrophorhabdaceae bacterium]
MEHDPGVVDFLSQPENYPERVALIDHVETHISHVFVCDDFAYKIKKPVSLGFVDFSSLKKRRFFCKREIALNARLAKDIYLSVLPIYRTEHGYSFAPHRAAHIVEYAIKMKRISMDCLLFKLVSDGRPLYGEMERVGATLADFHKSSSPYRGKRYGTYETITHATSQNFEQIKPYLGLTIDAPLLERLMEYTRAFLESDGGLFSARKRSLHVRDGHGDLHCQHICLEQPPIIFDCIEFNDAFRVIDVLLDVAFLFMDLEYRGRFDLSSRLLAAYFSRQKDEFHRNLLTFYKVYRAVVRGKVEGFRAAGLAQGKEREEALKAANDYFRLADYYVADGNKHFNPIVFMGLSGSGKSTIARDFSSHAIVLKSDEVRKQLAGLESSVHMYEDYGKGIYAPELTDKFYGILLEKTLEHAGSGQKVVVDATYLTANHRRDFYYHCRKRGLNPFFVHCFADEKTLRKRITQRIYEGTDPSDAHLGVLDHQLEHREDPEELPSYRVLKINTDHAVHDIVSALKEFL